MDKLFTVYIDNIPKFIIPINISLTIIDIKTYFNNNYYGYEIKMYINPTTELKVFENIVYDNVDLKSVWSQINNGNIFLFKKSTLDKIPTLTGLFDTDVLILLNLDEKGLGRICQVNQYIRKICNDERFWQSKVRKEYGNEVVNYKPLNITYHDQYIDLKTTDLTRYNYNYAIEKIVKDKRYDIILAYQILLQKYSANLIMLTAQSGDLELLKFLYHLNIINEFDVIEHAADSGNIEMVKWLIQKGETPTSNAVDRTIYSNHYDLMKWFITNNFLPSGLGIFYIATKGRIDILEWLIEHGIQLNDDLYKGAAEGGHVNVMNWLEKNNVFINVDKGNIEAYLASEHGHINVLKWLIDRDIFPTKRDIEKAARNNQVQVLEWMKNNGFVLTQDINDNELLCDVAKYGHLNVIKWLVNNGFKINKYIPDCALEGEHTNVLEWLYNQGFMPSENEIKNGLEEGLYNVKIIQWLKDKTTQPRIFP